MSVLGWDHEHEMLAGDAPRDRIILVIEEVAESFDRVLVFDWKLDLKCRSHRGDLYH